MSERKIPESNTDRMVQQNRAPAPQPERAGTGPESQTYQQRTGVHVANDPANKPVGKAEKTGERKQILPPADTEK